MSKQGIGDVPPELGLASDARWQLVQRLLQAPQFRHSARLQQFLLYIAHENLMHPEHRLIEQDIGCAVFGKPRGYDPVDDNIVRVQARLLRQKLTEYFRNEGRDEPLTLSVPKGGYVPEFLSRTPQEQALSVPMTVSVEPVPAAEPEPARGNNRVVWLLGLAGVVLAALGIWAKFSWDSRHAAESVILPAAGNSASVRILAGYGKAQHVDRFGNLWWGDRFFTGGRAVSYESIPFFQLIPDQVLLQHARVGEFRYDVPLGAGPYEMRLYFVETDYGPGLVLEGGENNRTFDIYMNGQRIARQFDIFATAGGNNAAAVLTFRDVRPAADGKLHLRFVMFKESPSLSAIELTPGIAGRMVPIRMVAGDRSYTDSSGATWNRDTWFTSGRLSRHSVTVANTADPGLYQCSRYGHFSYCIPVPKGRYTLTLHFAETYFGAKGVGKQGGVGSRRFHVISNATTLLRDFDIYKEAGGENRALALKFRGIESSAQGTIRLEFIPVVNYASIRAIEVVDEAR